LVSKYISEINFASPAHQSDVIEIGVGTVEVGRTSICLCSEVRNRDTQEKILSINKIVVVALNSKGKPTMHKRARMEHELRRPNWARKGTLRWLKSQLKHALDEQNRS
jgi:acyl-CoA thioesterase YciA